MLDGIERATGSCAPGVEHGRSETIIGRWIAGREDRDAIVLATEVGRGHEAVRNLRANTIEREAPADQGGGLARALQTGRSRPRRAVRAASADEYVA